VGLGCLTCLEQSTSGWVFLTKLVHLGFFSFLFYFLKGGWLYFSEKKKRGETYNMSFAVEHMHHLFAQNLENRMDLPKNIFYNPFSSKNTW
jgi:hypothetical protein